MKVLLFLMTLGGCLIATFCNAQDKKHYHVEQKENRKKINLSVNAASVNCKIKSTYNHYPVNIYGYPDNSNFLPIKQDLEKDNIRYIEVAFDQDGTQGLSSSLSQKVFYSSSPNQKSPWLLYLARDAVFDLNLNYGMGDAEVDLSDLAIEKLKINTGKADVKLSYDTKLANKTIMDTLYAKVDLGTLEINKLDLANAKEVIAEVGFGKLTMLFTDECKTNCHITASVGAGNLEVLFDNSETAVIITIDDTPLCRIKMPRSFKEIRPNTFVNKAYRNNASKLLSFDVNLGMGKVVFATTE